MLYNPLHSLEMHTPTLTISLSSMSGYTDTPTADNFYSSPESHMAITHS